MKSQTTILGTPKAADWVETVAPYSAQKNSAPIDLKLDANEGPVEIKGMDNLLKKVAVNRYPDKSVLENQIATQFDVNAAQVLVTCGGDDAIDRICRTYLQAGRNIVVPKPTFSMIQKYVSMTAAESRSVAWTDGDFPLHMVQRSADENTAVIAVVSPNNPTGAIISTNQLRELALSFPSAVMLVDQAYAEFQDDKDEDLTDFCIRELQNAIVIRTFSKAYGLAGLRIGYAIGPAKLMDWVRRTGSPYPVSTVSLAIASNALDQESDDVNASIRSVISERTELQKLLIELGAEPLPSQANFVFARFPSPTLTAEFVCSGLASLGISVRSFGDQPDALRITCPGNERDFDRLCLALKTVMAPEAILFDLDGVLVDETPSYREAIRQTCRSFGLKITLEEISQLKLAGDANNDWDFTLRTLSDAGIECEFADVKERFEKLYQGDETHEGFWRCEKCLIDADWLSKLATRCRVGIVTGRPSQDAQRFLTNNRLGQHFEAIVCMEDGPAKPDPANVRTAMSRLAVQSAWLIGDTPDDLTAARHAGVLPLGIVAPQDAPALAIEMLNQAFAARVFPNLESFQEFLS